MRALGNAGLLGDRTTDIGLARLARAAAVALPIGVDAVCVHHLRSGVAEVDLGIDSRRHLDARIDDERRRALALRLRRGRRRIDEVEEREPGHEGRDHLDVVAKRDRHGIPRRHGFGLLGTRMKPEGWLSATCGPCTSTATPAGVRRVGASTARKETTWHMPPLPHSASLAHPTPGDGPSTQRLDATVATRASLNMPDRSASSAGISAAPRSFQQLMAPPPESVTSNSSWKKMSNVPFTGVWVS